MKPIKLLFILSFLLLVTYACSSGGATADNLSGNASTSNNETVVSSGEAYPTNTPGPLSQRTEAGSFFEINEVGLGPDGYVALTNFTDVEVTLEGLYLCQGSDCFALPNNVVQGNETVLIAVGNGSGLENVIAKQATIGELRSADGELALFSSSDTSDPSAMLIYLQWGSTPHELTDLAVERGLWFESSYAPSGENATKLFRNQESGLWLWE